MNLPVACLLIATASFAARLEGCSSSGSIPATSRQDSVAGPPGGRPPAVAPDRCRLACTVLAIDSLREATGPCSKVPCTAIVRIDSILGYGFSFPPVLSVGQTLRTRFVFTTGRSELSFPALGKRYPGVRVGTRLVADAELAGSPDSPRESSGLVVDDYAIR